MVTVIARKSYRQKIISKKLGAENINLKQTIAIQDNQIGEMHNIFTCFVTWKAQEFNHLAEMAKYL